MTLISLRILVSYAKSTHRHLAHVFGISPPSRTVGDIHGPGDKGAGRGLSEYHGWFGEPLRADEEEKEAEGSEEKGGLPWQPLTPRLLQEVQRLAMEGKERPLTAAAVVAVALPFSGAAVFIGAPVLAGDAALQWGARTPVGRAAGQTTHNAVEVSWLHCLSVCDKYRRLGGVVVAFRISLSIVFLGRLLVWSACSSLSVCLSTKLTIELQ